MDDTKKNGQERHRFCTRLPAVTYRHLRSLAHLPPTKVASESKCLLLRFPEETYQKLRKLAIARSSAGGDGAVVSMQSVLISLIEDRYFAERQKGGNSERGTMAGVVVDLITSAKLRPSTAQKHN